LPVLYAEEGSEVRVQGFRTEEGKLLVAGYWLLVGDADRHPNPLPEYQEREEELKLQP